MFFKRYGFFEKPDYCTTTTTLTLTLISTLGEQKAHLVCSELSKCRLTYSSRLSDSGFGGRAFVRLWFFETGPVSVFQLDLKTSSKMMKEHRNVLSYAAGSCYLLSC